MQILSCAQIDEISQNNGTHKNGFRLLKLQNFVFRIDVIPDDVIIDSVYCVEASVEDSHRSVLVTVDVEKLL